MAGCEYYVNGEWISINAFKEMLNAGLLDNLVASKQITLPGFKVNQDKVVKEETKEVINDSVPAIKLAEILANEIKTRQGYPLNMLSALELNAEQTEFKIPLWASPYAKKFESLLTSLVSNKVVKQKLFGGSYVLGSEEGIKIKEGDETSGDLKNSNIVFSSKFDASQGLLPMRIDKETGKVLPAQIMIPFKFRNEAGEILDVNEFTTKDAKGRTILDTTKIPEKLLQLFGFRIPTQERNSMAAVEIVGFLPEAMGDLILAPRDFTKQMGSDFDVDKLYTYMYNHFYKDGKLHTNFKSSKKDIEALTDVVKESIKMFKEDMKLSKEDRKLLDNYIEDKLGYNENDDKTTPELLKKASDIINQALSQENKKRIDDAVDTLSILDRSYKAARQNKLLDIHLQIMTSNNPEVIASVLALDSFGEFEDLAKEINDIRIAQGLVPPITTILSETYQRTKFVNATAGKSGVGTFSLDSTFNATAQGKDLTLINLNEENTTKLFGTFLEPRTPSASEILEANEVVTAFGDIESKGDMSNKYTLRSQALLKKGNLTDKEKASLKMKSSIIRALQSTAVDNEKAQILDKLNINNDTFDAIRALAILGFEEGEIVGLITQEIIWEYVELLKNANSSLTSYDSKAKENIVQQLIEKYDTDKKYDKLSAKDRERYSNKSAEELRNDIATQKLIPGANNDFNLGQLVLLDKFLKLSEIGVDIKSVQSAINTESQGLPKSLIEVDIKVNQIKNLAYSNIFNATKLLGDVEGEGLTPTTINGYAAVYGTMFADGIFNKYFPYKQPGFKDVVQEVLSHTPTSAVISTSKQVSTQEDVFKDIRSYLYATTNTNLFNGNPDAERARLFIDTKTNQSLASILTVLSSQKWYQKNAFLNKLTPDLNKDGTVSTINFEAATGENLDEKSIYAGFVYLLDKNVPLGTFNGIPYTSRLLAQDLVAAAFLEGGNQGAKQYLKFVPTSYLKTIGFGDYLNDVKFNFEDTFKGFKGKNGISYHQPSAFTRQYIQNNPSKAKTVSLGDLQANAVITPQEFTLNKEALKNNIITINDPITGEEVESQTHFLSIYDSELPSNYALYEFDTVDRVYKQIPTLAGKYGFVQYNANNSIVIPVEAPKTKQPIVQQSNPQYTVQNTPTTSSQTFNPNVINNTEVVTTKDLSISKSLSGTKEALQDLFNNLIYSNEISPLNRLLLNTYQSLQLPKNFKIEYTTEGGRGSYNRKTHVLKINLANEDNNTIDGLATTLAHELSHTFTSETIQLFEEGKLENLTEEQINICKNLKRLQTEYVQDLIAKGDVNNLLGFYKTYWSWKLKNNPIALKQKLEEEILGLKIALNTPNITLENKQNISKYYGGIKLTEFVTMALTDADFQQHLNEITDSEGVSWWDKIKSALTLLMSKLGFDVKKGSLLGTALRDSWDLIKVNQKMLKTKDNVFNTTDNLFTTKIDQFTYSYNPETNEVIHNAKTGNKIETNTTQINKVLVKYALANNYEQRTFNGSTYIAIADRVLNIKNANEVSPETWESAKPTQPSTSVEPVVNNKYELFPGAYANQGQTEAIDKIKEFLASDERAFLLRGRGGTGKTAIIKKIVESLPSGSVLAIAPSHKPKKVLNSSINADRTSPITTITLASALAIKLNETTGKFEPNEYARKKGRIPIKKAKYIIIDESSMISDKLLDEINKFTQGAKIIFMGDRAQLPPIGQETDSKVFNLKNNYTLTEIMRQGATSPIIGLGKVVSENVESTNIIANPITNDMRVDAFDPVSGSSVEWISNEDVALNQFVSDIKNANEDVNFAKIVTFNNENNNSGQSVKNLNIKVRNKLFGTEGAKQQFNQGELLTAYDSFGGEIPIFDNSEDFTVENSTLTPNYPMHVSTSSNAKGVRTLNLNFDVVLLTLKNEDGKLIPNIPVIAESSKQAYNALITELSKKDLQLMYAVKEKYANLQYGYAITSHKAQGSTYTNVYVMEDNIMGKSNGGSVKSKNQSLYVAVSRPTTKLVMVSSKNSKIAPGLSNLNFEALGNAGAFSSSNFNPEDYEGRIRDEGPSEDDWNAYYNSTDEMLEESPISEENVENYSLLCGK